MRQVEQIGCLNNGIFVMNFSIQWFDSKGSWYTSAWNSGNFDNGLYKVSPLLKWSEKQIWEYIRKRRLPYNTLHDRGFPSIGCQPCTRAVKPGEDIRAGRWWWENPDQKECGLHARH